MCSRGGPGRQQLLVVSPKGKLVPGQRSDEEGYSVPNESVEDRGQCDLARGRETRQGTGGLDSLQSLY